MYLIKNFIVKRSRDVAVYINLEHKKSMKSVYIWKMFHINRTNNLCVCMCLGKDRKVQIEKSPKDTKENIF